MEVQRSDKKAGQRIRSEHASQQWLENEYGWGNRRARRLITGWRVLGLHDESRVMPWINEGGMLEVSMQKREDVEEENGDNDNSESPRDKAGRVPAEAEQCEQ